MVQTTLTKPGKDTYDKVLSAVKDLIEADQKHINICWPTATTSLFMRKRMNRDLVCSLGVRHTTSTQLRTLIDDASSQTDKYSSPTTLNELSLLSKIASQVLPDKSSWRSTKVIDETLRVISGSDSKSRKYIESNFSSAQKCVEMYSKLSSFNISSIESQAYDFNVKHIMGSCIIVKNVEYEQDSNFLIDSFPEHVQHVFCLQEKRDIQDLKKLVVFEDAFDEIDSVLKKIIESRPRADSSVIIVPDSAYKKLTLTRSQKFSVPTSGKTEINISDHDLILFAKEILGFVNEPKNEVLISFLQRFTWLNANEKNNVFLAKKLLSLISEILETNKVSTKFQKITQFLVENMSTKSFEKDEKTQSTSQEAFSILEEMSELEEECNTSDCIFLLNFLGAKSISGNKLGSGIYVALPDEVLGSYFDNAYLVGLRDRYISPMSFTPSLINRDQYLVLGIKDELAASSHLNSSLNWLKSCAADLHFSSSYIDIGGKETALPYWARTSSSTTKTVSVEKIDSQFEYDDKYLRESLSVVTSSKNIAVRLAQPESISATAIETLATCPLKYFFKHELKLQSEYENPNPDLIDKKDFGNIIHELLQNFVEQKQSPDDLFNALDSSLEALRETGELPNAASININRASLVRMLDAFLELDASKLSDLTQSEVVVENEIEFGDEKIKIKGMIDRVDTYSTGMKNLIDYKTGKFNDKSSIDFFHFGRKLQLAIYALLIPNSDCVSALEYWYLGEDSTKVCAQNIDASDLETIKLKVGNILSVLPTGLFPAKPYHTLKTTKETKEVEHCSDCEFDGICYSENKVRWNQFAQDPNFEKYTSVVLDKAALNE